MIKECKPCPFCGAKAKQDKMLKDNNFVVRHKKYCVFYNTSRDTSWWYVWSEDRASWNRRAK